MIRLLPNPIVCLLFMLLCFSGVSPLMSQTPSLADQVILSNNVDDPENATADNGAFAVLNSYGGDILGGGSFSGELELAYPSQVPANTTTYIQIDFDEDILNSLLGGSLGTLLAEVIGTVVFGNHYFNVEARSGASTVLSKSSLLPPDDWRFRIVQDEAENFYIAITPNQPYDRIYIEDNTDALLLGTFNSMNVYKAFYYAEAECAIDPLYTDFDGDGLTVDLLGLGGAGVTNAHHAIDQDTTNFSELSLGIIGVAASIEQNIYFPKTYSPSETLEITLQTEPTLVTLGILNEVEVLAFDKGTLTYNNDINTLLTADLLTLLQNGEQATIPISPGVAFDRITVRLNSLIGVSLSQSLDLYGVSIMGPATPTTADDTQTFCLVDAPTIADLNVNEPQVIWYDDPVAGTPFDPTDPLSDGETYYAAQLVDGCESDGRLAVTVTINDTEVPTTTNPTQDFCVIDTPTVADLEASGPMIQWYGNASGGTPLDPTDPLTNGATYYATATGANGCESADRLEVTVSVSDTPTPTTSDATQEFCAVEAPTVADLQADGPMIVWYDAATGGTAYDSTDALLDGTIYYASATDASGCESSNRLEVTVSIEDTSTPTTANTNQEFCVVADPTVADLQADGPDIQWYDDATGGTPLDPSEPLVDGATYYATATGTNGCESSNRLEVTTTLNDTPTPTTDNSTQAFCLSDAPTIADLQAEGPSIQWYLTPNGGTPLDPTELLTDATTYYATATNGTGCESAERLEVSVNLTDPGAPTTDDSTQSFCAIDMPTVADLSASGGSITWYDMESGGTPLDPTEPLADGQTYYATATDTNGCESSERLEVLVAINDTDAPTTDDPNPSFCVVDVPTIADLNVEGPNILWYEEATGGTPIDPSVALVSGTTYYASATGTSNCESANRLPVTVTLEDTDAPTTDNDLQAFCRIDNPTVADLQADGSNIIWYDSPIDGTPYNPTDPLTDGTTYYATATGANGCESANRLEVVVQLNNTAPPTTDDSSQVFCTTEAPTVADLQVDGPGIIWYDMPTGGTPYESTDPLSDGTTYYASATGASGCESTERLEVTVSLDPASDPTIASENDGPACLETVVTYTTEVGQDSYIWNINGGIVTDGGSTNDNFISVRWTQLEDTNVSVSYTPVGECNTGSEVTFSEEIEVCADITITKTVNNERPRVGENITFFITVTNDGPNDFEGLRIAENIPSGFELVSFETTLGTYDPSSGLWLIDLLPAEEMAQLSVVVEVLGSGNYTNIATIISSQPLDDDANNAAEITVEPECLTIYNEFSPNADGFNDRFTITCIENYPNNELQIYNRYGSLVYQERGYENQWEGTSNVAGANSSQDGLPAGTYYYILKLDNDTQAQTGWLYLMK
ncbi:Ig-like domain-containing protein [Altibacter sp. HG106]|uniref:Ig-like domain-containing protein n=1 Tax=Altibacter sp. HG106 TaxID=3023937 RepID=UPI0023500174|nr:gliding motility-associated C-terminal domain-containing protein [Altibacter sp. HG106]MDC7993568.1 gliding motility-associated C-terminal domain-containing protein [Altibacter sp. HG106]